MSLIAALKRVVLIILVGNTAALAPPAATSTGDSGSLQRLEVRQAASDFAQVFSGTLTITVAPDATCGFDSLGDPALKTFRSEKTGFSHTLKELRGVKGSIWATIFGSDGLGGMFSFLHKRENDEILTVQKLLVHYFIPTSEYMKQALEIDNVAFHINNTKRKNPVYLVTGLM
ncbi:hypothetical protein Neosp_004335 [[Neocosmospora] mangrovei]